MEKRRMKHNERTVRLLIVHSYYKNKDTFKDF